MTFNQAWNELDAIRNDRHACDADTAKLIARVDAVGQWAASRKTNKNTMKLLEECHRLHDLLNGGSGRGGNRIQLV